MQPARWKLSQICTVVSLAVTMTLLNAIKPLHMDDSVYYSYASHLAEHPTDPYGSKIAIYWSPPRSGMDVLVPMLLPYVWSIAHRIHGDNTFLCKLWLFPFALMLIYSTWGLARRFAPGRPAICALLVGFSPAILPGMNFMLDIPALSLGILAIYIFTHACDRNSFALSLLSGLLAGLAINTKWTGIVVPGAIGLYALTHRRVTLGILAGLVAAGVFGGWEFVIKLQYGTSHFLHHSANKQPITFLNPIKAHVAILGGVCPSILLLGLIGLKRYKFALVISFLTVLSFGLIGVGVPAQPIYLVLGVLLLINLSTVSGVLLLRRPRLNWRGDYDMLFLVLWLGLEIVGIIVLSPYAAVRRVVGVVVVATLLVGRIYSITGRSALMSKTPWVAAFGVILGLFYYGVDLHEARVEKAAAETTASEVLALAKPGETAWFVGRWGFRHYASLTGLKQLAAGHTELKRGDLLVVHENKMSMEANIVLDPAQLDEILTLKFDENSSFPFRTVPSYYAGKEPVQRQFGPRFVVHVYRVTNPFLALGLMPREYVDKNKPVGAMRSIDVKK